jgi:hypothetical protein
MRGPRPTTCTFPAAFLQEARSTVRRRTASVQAVQRFRLALLFQDDPTLAHAIAAQQVGLSVRQVQRWRRRWARGDFSVEDREGRGRKATFSPTRSGLRHGHRV